MRHRLQDGATVNPSRENQDREAKMTNDCANTDRCSFFIRYGKDEDKSLAIAGFLRKYCRGPHQEDCLRKVVSAALGGPEHVPANMLPNGLPMTGTSTDDWPEEAKDVRRRVGADTKG